MEIKAVKLELFDWLHKIEDKSLLASLLQFKKANEKGDWLSSLTPQQIKSLEEGLNDIKNGDVISSREFWLSYGRKI